jgi:RNA polymerase sigma factor (sigma-70 family)
VIYLLDVNILIAAIWRDHQDHRRVEAWLRRKQTATCPIGELAQRIAAQSSRQFTDWYLAELAEKHRMKLATLDTHILHRAIEVVAGSRPKWGFRCLRSLLFNSSSRPFGFDWTFNSGATFCLIRGCQLTITGFPLSTIGGDTKNGAVAFTTTHWSVVLTAQGRSPAADEALEKLCRTYWWPLYGFVRRNGYGPEEAQDLTQGFFALLLERRDLDVVRREKGRLRSYLLVSLKNFLAKAKRRELAVKRGEGRALVPLDELLAREHADLEPADSLTADRIFERRWALTLLEQVLERLEREYQSTGNAKLFDCLKEFLSDEPGHRSQAEVAAALGMSENAVKQAFHRLRQRYRQLLRDEIAQTVAVPGDVEDELRHFISVLQS